MPARKPEKTDPRALISDPAARAMLGQISKMTSTRWRDDPRIGWPRIACVIRGRNYFFRAEIEALRDKLIAMTAAGESSTVQPALPRSRGRKAAEAP